MTVNCIRRFRNGHVNKLFIYPTECANWSFSPKVIYPQTLRGVSGSPVSCKRHVFYVTVGAAENHVVPYSKHLSFLVGAYSMLCVSAEKGPGSPCRFNPIKMGVNRDQRSNIEFSHQYEKRNLCQESPVYTC